MWVIVADDLIVGSHDAARRRIIDAWQSARRDPSVPFAIRQPTWTRQQSQIMFPARDPTGQDIADVAVHIGVGHILARVRPARQGGLELIPITRFVQTQEGGHIGAPLMTNPA